MNYFGKRKIVSVGLIHCNSGRRKNLGTARTLRIVGVSLQTIFRRKIRVHFLEAVPGIDYRSNISSVFSQRLGRNRSTRKLLATISGLAAIFVFACTGCQSYHGETLAASGQQPGLLSPGDTIKISFTTAPELNQSEKIEPSGRVTLPLVGDVSAAGKTTGQFQAELTQLYKTQLQNSDVIVTLEAVAIPVVVSGEVQRPGKIIFERPATVLEAIMEAGGFTPYGDPKRISVIRQVNGVQHTQIVDLSPLLHGVPTRVMYVNRGDVIYVRPRFISF
jgi:polysaccharide biosynthesis/export protein